MQKTKSFFTKNKWNIVFYLSGFLILGLGVNIMKASDLGNGAWDTVTINVRGFFHMNLDIQWVTMGMVSFSVSFIIMLIVLSYRRKAKYLLMLLPIFLVAFAIDFWNLIVFRDQILDNIIIQIIFFTLGLLLLPLGLTLIVKSKFTAFVFDELMLMFVKITGAKKITYVRLIIEITGISIGALFGYFTYYHINGSFGAVDIGSFILAIILSPIMAFYFKLFKIEKES